MLLILNPFSLSFSINITNTKVTKQLLNIDNKITFDYNDKFRKFQTPENWFVQVAKISDLEWPIDPKVMDEYKLGFEPSKQRRLPEQLLRELGHHPYRAKQPNGWSDHSDDWISPELLIRRLVYAKLSHSFSKMQNNNENYYQNIVEKNFGRVQDQLF